MKLPHRRQFLQLAAGAAAVPVLPRIAWAQAYPSRSITMIVPFAAGGILDMIGRLLAERMRASLGQPVIVDNVGGGDGSIGVGRLARAKADGYTIDIGMVATHVLNGGFYSLPYNMLTDFAPIVALGRSPYLLCGRKTMPARDLAELIAWLKANPDKASAGVSATTQRLLTAFLKKETRTQFTLVPYRGIAPAMQDLVAGHIDLIFAGYDTLPLALAGTVKPYAVTSDTRMSLAPDTPTFGEIGLPSLSISNWFGLFAPKGTASDIIRKLNAAAVEALADPTMRSTPPPSFVAAMAELASIADAGEAWRGPRRSATSPRRKLLPNDRTPRLTGGGACTGPQAVITVITASFMSTGK
jgi:tripartite-type tricarboxylate transporter receptor subunit TctC